MEPAYAGKNIRLYGSLRMLESLKRSAFVVFNADADAHCFCYAPAVDPSLFTPIFH